MTLVSVFGLFALFNVQTAALILLLSLGIIFLCLLRLNVFLKLLGLVLVGYAILRWRTEGPIKETALAVVPVLGTIFMLRVVSYLREVKKDPKLGGWKETLAFFLVLPNYVMWFFPLIDYKNFIRGAQRPRDLALLQNGVDWILDGVLQLLLYKALQAALYHPFEYVHTYGDFFAFLFLNYLNYIRISGAFHIVTGTICLYGVELPRTHRLYMFSASCAEVGRRLNSYWKDFMAWNFYRPSFQFFQKWGKGKALAASILIVFSVSCLMHEYIYLWSKGTFALRLEDVLFWGVIGLWIGLDIYFELRAKQKGKADQKRFFALWVRVTFCFFLFSVIWAVWNASSVGDLFTTFWLAEWKGLPDLKWLLVFPLVGLMGAVYKCWFEDKECARGLWRDTQNLLLLLIAMILTLPQVPKVLRMPPAVARTFNEFLDPKYQPEFEAQTRTHSYYDGLKNSQLTTPVDEDELPIDQQPYFEAVSDYRRRHLSENSRSVFMGHEFFTNRWRMNDERDYSLQKTPGKLRVVVMSASNSMSYGIPNGTSWPRVAEEALKKQKGIPPLEILNFSVIGYSALVIPYHFEREVARFKPDIVVYGGGARELWLNSFNASYALRNGLSLPYQEELLPLLGLKSSTGFFARHYMVGPSYDTSWALFRWGINKLAQQSRALGAELVYALTPMRIIDTQEEQKGNYWDGKKMLEEAHEAGYATIDLGQILDPYAVKEVTLFDDHENYNHYNEKGHALVGEKFAEGFTKYLKARFPTDGKNQAP
jgi:hypothetical protein